MVFSTLLLILYLVLFGEDIERSCFVLPMSMTAFFGVM